MKHFTIILLMASCLAGVYACGGDDDECNKSLCDKCVSDKDCCEGSCERLYDIDTGMPVGKFCVDTIDRVCEY